MTAPARTIAPNSALPAGPRRWYSISIGFAVLFIFLQSLTAGEFITGGLADDTKEVWTTIHGFTSYPVMIASLAATVIAYRYLRASPRLALLTGALFVGSVVQWLLGHAITTLGMDWVTPLHVALAFVVYGLAIVLSIRSASLRKV